jgi:hypothetical protein
MSIIGTIDRIGASALLFSAPTNSKHLIAMVLTVNKREGLSPLDVLSFERAKLNRDS